MSMTPIGTTLGLARRRTDTLLSTTGAAEPHRAHRVASDQRFDHPARRTNLVARLGRVAPSCRPVRHVVVADVGRAHGRRASRSCSGVRRNFVMLLSIDVAADLAVEARDADRAEPAGRNGRSSCSCPS